MKNDKKRGGVQFSKNHQPPNEAKRKKKGRTVLRESIGLESWDSIQEYLLTKGAKKFIDSIHSLRDRQFVMAYLDAMEYFKPKLQRTELTGKDGKDLSATPPAISSATIEQLHAALEAHEAGENGLGQADQG